jgi:hypothetical protein
MKFIKQVSTTFLLLTILFLFNNCATSKQFTDNIPFNIDNVYAETIGSHTNLYVKISSNTDAVLDSVYYQNNGQKLNLSKENLYVAHFSTEKKIPTDFNVDISSLKEYGNTVSKKTKETPPTLSSNDCLISYKTGEKTDYYKIENVENKTTTTSTNQ